MTKITLMKRGAGSTPASSAGSSPAPPNAMDQSATSADDEHELRHPSSSSPSPHLSSPSASATFGAPIPPERQPCADPAEALALLNAEVGKLRDTRSDLALYRAYAQQPQLFDDEHQKAFLRAEDNVVKSAAERMVAYWEARLDLFGEQRWLLPMDKSGTLKDIDSLALDRGIVQILPERDTEGRTLLYYDPSRHDPKAGYRSDSMLRVLWYHLHVAMADPVTCENGFVLIVYPRTCTPEQIDRTVIAKGTSILGTVIPLPWRGFHICHPCTSYNKYFPLVKMLAPRRMKDEIVVHFGTEEHVLECMAQYHVPKERLPTEFGGEVALDYDAWLAARKQSEGEDALRVTDPVPEPEEDEEMEDASSSAMAPAAVGSRPSTASPSSSSPAPDGEASGGKSGGSGAKTKRPGRKGDARMHRAVTVKMANNELSLVEALQDGGFHFEGLNEKGKPHHEVFDQDGVSLMQRKNQLLRRIRMEKKKRKEEEEGGDK